MKLYNVLIFLLLACFNISCAHMENAGKDKIDCRSPGSIFAIAYRGDVVELHKHTFSKEEVNLSVKGKECQGWTPIIIASAEGHTDMVKELILLGADVNAMNPLGRTALMFASRHGYEQIAEQLLKAGADPNAITEHNGPRKAIIAAALQGHASVVHLNLKYGAKVSEKDCAAYEDACIRIAAVLAGVEQNFEQSNQLLRPICSRGNPVACRMIRANQCAVEHPSDVTFCEKLLLNN